MSVARVGVASTARVAAASTGRMGAAATALLAICILIVGVLAPASPAQAATHRDAELEFIRLVNHERTSRGLVALTERFDIRDVAYAWSEQMAREDRLYHNPEFSSQICCWLRVAENVAMSKGRGWAEAVAVLHRALMESPGHRANILGEHSREIGVGVWFDGHAMWVTQNFRQPDGTVAPDGTEPTRDLAEPVVRSIDGACPATLTLVAFLDVVEGSFAERAISCIVAWDVAEGTSAGRFSPAGTVSRGQMATFVANSIEQAGGELPNVTRADFSDTRGHTHEGSIAQLASDGLVSGCGGGRFCPNAPVTRAQMATFLAEAWTAISGGQLPAGPEHFADDDTNLHEDSIDAIAAAGLAGGIRDGAYAPGRSVTRAQMAAFVARLLDLAVDEGHALPPTLETTL